MSFWHWLFRRIVSAKTFAAMEADSQRWRMRCLKCGHETSIWEMGGIKYRARGDSYTLGRCGKCGKRFMGKLYCVPDDG